MKGLRSDLEIYEFECSWGSLLLSSLGLWGHRGGRLPSHSQISDAQCTMGQFYELALLSIIHLSTYKSAIYDMLILQEN